MDEEEKKAIDKLQYTIEINQNILNGIEIDEQVIKSMETTLNLIDKQQKEIERLKEFEKYYENEKVIWQRKDYVSKDKIKELIEEKAMTDTYNFKTIAVKDIEELLGE